MSDAEAQTEMHHNFIESEEGKKVASRGGHQAGSSRDRVCTNGHGGYPARRPSPILQ